MPVAEQGAATILSDAAIDKCSRDLAREISIQAQQNTQIATEHKVNESAELPVPALVAPNSKEKMSRALQRTATTTNGSKPHFNPRKLCLPAK